MEFTDTSTKTNSWSNVITIQAKSPVWRDEAKRKAMFKVLIKLDYFGVVSSED
jgi:hypothetical protein